MKMLAAYWVLMRLLWRYGIARLKRVLIGVRDMVAVGDDKLDDLVMTHDTYMVQLYRVAAENEGMGLREFLLHYGLARKKDKGEGPGEG